MRLALTSGAAFVGGEMCHISSHALCTDQRAIWVHLMITYKHVHAHGVQVMFMHTYNKTEQSKHPATVACWLMMPC